MKTIKLCLFASVLFLIASCSSNQTEETFSMEDRVGKTFICDTGTEYFYFLSDKELIMGWRKDGRSVNHTRKKYLVKDSKIIVKDKNLDDDSEYNDTDTELDLYNNNTLIDSWGDEEGEFVLYVLSDLKNYSPK